MTSKVYRTAQGKTVDMGRLALQNENVRAVGNMKVNARGDMVDDMNRVVSTKTEQVQKQYNHQINKRK
jgi:phage tail protein X